MTWGESVVLFYCVSENFLPALAGKDQSIFTRKSKLSIERPKYGPLLATLNGQHEFHPCASTQQKYLRGEKFQEDAGSFQLLL